jgi:hypothetical protein
MTTPPVLPQALKAHAFRECELLFALAGDDRLRESESQDDRQRCVRDVVCPSETCGVDPIVVVDRLKACEVETTLNRFDCSPTSARALNAFDCFEPYRIHL